ncbi:hypothetical protein IAT38_004824 [Cryptococcus sp. DSM 104549]
MSLRQSQLSPLDQTRSSTPSSGRVAYYYDWDVGNYHFGLGHPMKPHRIRMAHSLVVNYGLADSDDEDDGRAVGEHDGRRAVNGDWTPGEEGQWEQTSGGKAGKRRMEIFRPTRATKQDMTRFHTDEYIDVLKVVSKENADSITGNGTRFLTGADCPAVDGIFEFSSISAGGSLGAAERLNQGRADIAINWAGGLHHAKKNEASGFCYVNDIVLGILELLRYHSRVLYIDVDVHHGDGVEEAFYTTDRVMTCSFHKYGGFFPGTGNVKDMGLKKGSGYAVNVPLHDGATDQSYQSIFKPVIQRIIDHYRPNAIVLQMGADSVAGDKLGRLNLSLEGHAECARFVKSFNLPTMMLGGGGYTTKNVARAWTKETAVMVGKELSEDLPMNQYFEYYGPVYKLEVHPSNLKDYNSPQYLESIKLQIFEQLRNLPFAPSVQMRDVPTTSVARAIGLSKEWEADSPEDQLDKRLRDLLARRNLHATYTTGDDPESDDEAAGSRPGRARRQGGAKGPSRLAMPSGKRSRDEEDDPCGALDGPKTPAVRPRRRRGSGVGAASGDGQAYVPRPSALRRETGDSDEEDGEDVVMLSPSNSRPSFFPPGTDAKTLAAGADSDDGEDGVLEQGATRLEKEGVTVIVQTSAPQDRRTRETRPPGMGKRSFFTERPGVTGRRPGLDAFLAGMAGGRAFGRGLDDVAELKLDGLGQRGAVVTEWRPSSRSGTPSSSGE